MNPGAVDCTPVDLTRAFDATPPGVTPDIVMDGPNHLGAFEDALSAMKHGLRVARRGWNGRGMAVWLVHRATGGLLPYLVMRTAKREFVPWLASQTDLLADDWEVAS